MKKRRNESFINPTKGVMKKNEMIADIAGFVDEEPGSFYRLVIGTDSQTRRNNGKSEIDFVSAVIVHRIGRGARYYWRKEKIDGEKVLLRDKIYKETLMSLDVAQSIVPKIRKVVSPAKYDLEIHIDVGPLGPTREMIREVVGMVNGNGFIAKTKPESWGASSVADKHA
ncbi:ribonuclease H-like YkuK family protein [Patescibacteria group bacterium]|nr:ribonuclease H-like YkuK family protein [Patescibacteria group bacterium]